MAGPLGSGYPFYYYKIMKSKNLFDGAMFVILFGVGLTALTMGIGHDMATNENRIAKASTDAI